jgi:hypothetical protein
VHLIWHLLSLHTLVTLPTIGQSVSIVHSTHLLPTQVKPAPSTLQVSIEMPSEGVHDCVHFPLSHKNFEPSHTHCAWYVWQSKVNPPSHACKRDGQPAGGLGQQSLGSWHDISTHCFPVGCRLRLPTLHTLPTQTSPVSQSALARHDWPRPLSFDASWVLLSELQAAKSAPTMKKAATVPFARARMPPTPSLATTLEAVASRKRMMTTIRSVPLALQENLTHASHSFPRALR